MFFYFIVKNSDFKTHSCLYTFIFTLSQTNKPTEEKFHFNRNRNRNRNTQISAKRISQRLKPDGCFWSGHMIYYTNKKLDVSQN